MGHSQSSVCNLKGIIPPMITPLNEDLTLDKFHLHKLVNHIVGGGVHGLFLLGTTGEFAGLPFLVKIELIQETCRLVQGRVPVLVGITDCSLEESVRLAQVAKNAGAHALVAAPPFYMNVGQCELVKYFEELADRVKLPLFLYNMPSHTKISIEVETVKTLSSHPNIVGLKDSSGSAPYFQKLSFEMKENNPDFKLFVGPEEMMAESVWMGAHGGVNGGANLFPSLYVDLYEAAQSGDRQLVQELQCRVMKISQSIYDHGAYSSGYLMGLKTAMSFLGLCQDIFAPPLVAFDKKEKLALKEKFSQLMILQEPVR